MLKTHIILLLAILFFFKANSSFDFFISQNFTATVKGVGTLTQPYNNIFQAFQNVSTNTTFISSLQNATDKHVNFVLLSSYYLIQPNDFVGFTVTSTIKELNTINVPIRILPQFCYDNYYNNSDDCPSNNTVEIQFKCEIMKMQVNVSLKLVNIRITGKEIDYAYNSSLDSVCYNTSQQEQGCCANDSYFVFGTPNNRCLLVNHSLIRNENSVTTYAVIDFLTSNASLILTNFELSYFQSLKTTTYPQFTTFIYDGANNYNNLSLVLQNCTFYRVNLKLGIVFMTANKNSTFNFTNITVSEYNYYQILEYASTSSSAYAYAQKSLFNVNSPSATPSRIFVYNSSFINSTYAFRINNVNFTLANCQFGNFSRTYTSLLYSVDGFIVGFQITSTSTLNAETSNFTFSNLSIFNCFVNSSQASPSTSQYFINLRWNVTIFNVTFSNITLLKPSGTFLLILIRISANSIISMSNITMINYLSNSSIIFIDQNVIASFSNFSFSNLFPTGYGGIFTTAGISSINLQNSSFTNWTVSGYSDYFSSQTSTSLTYYGQGGVFFLGGSCTLNMSNVNFSNGAVPNGEGGIVYSENIAEISMIACNFQNITAFFSGSILNIQNYATSVIILNSTFEDIYGNAFMHLYWANLIVKNCIFINSYYYNSTTYGLFYLFENNTISIDNSMFINLNLNVQGGVIFCIHYNHINFTNLIFNNLNISQMNAIIYGEGYDVLNVINCTHDLIYVPYNLYYLEFQATVSIINVTFTNVLMPGVFNQLGGAFYFGEASVIFFDFLYVQNFTIQDFVSGGIIYLDKSNLTLNNSAIEQFFSGASGAIIYASSYIFLEVSNLSLNDVEGSSGGMLYSDLLNNVNIQGIYGNNVTSSLDGGVFYVNSENNITLSQLIFQNVGCQRYGGLFMGSNQNIIVFLNVDIQNSSAGSFGLNPQQSGEGGLIYLEESNNLIIVNFSSINSSSEIEGGCISFFGGSNNISVLSSTFNISRAVSGNGGFLSFTGTIGTNNLNFTEVFIFSCFAYNSGGFFSISNNFNQIAIYNSLFFDSEALYEFGGGFAIENSNNFLLYNSSFGQMICSLQGGFLYSDLNNILNITLCNVYNSSSSTANGGAFNIEQGNQLTVIQSNFSLSFCQFDGGAFYLYNNNTLVLFSCQIVNSASKDRGGLIAAFKSNQMYLNNSIFINSTTNLDGCFVYMYENNNFTLNNSNLTNMLQNTQSSLISTVFSSNVSVHFTAFYLNSVASVIAINENSNTVFSQNTFNKNSICVTMFIIDSSNLTIRRIAFDLNVSNYFANVQNSIVNIKKCNFKTRDAEMSAFLTFLSSTVIIQNSLFTKTSSKDYLMIYAESSNVSFYNNVAFSIVSNYSGALFAGLNSNFNSKFNFFFRNKAFTSGGVFSFSYDQNILNTVEIKSSVFFENTAYENGGSVYFQNSNTALSQTILIDKCILFFNLAGMKGGAVYVENANNFTLKQNSFGKNSAILKIVDDYSRAKGGALYNLNSTNYKILNNFTENIAQIGGASYTEGSNLPILIDNQYVNNLADFYGNDDATDVKIISFYETDDQNFQVKYFSINDVQSGNYYSNCLANITGLDEYNNVVYQTNEDYSDFIQINQISSLDLNNQFSFTMLEGFLCFNGIFKRNQLPIQSAFTYQISFRNQNTESLTLDLNFRNCLVGERLTDERTCDPCAVNTYSFVTDFTMGTTEKCLACDDTTNFYCFGGSNLTSKKNYWRSNELSTNFIKCKNTACLGDNRTMSILEILEGNYTYDPLYATSLCEPGYSGVLCNECDWNYGHVDPNTCLECGSATYNFNVIFELVLRLVFTVYSVFQEYIMVCSICSSKIDHNEVITTNILKIFVNHMQVLTIIFAFPFEWPSEFNSALSIFLSFSPNVSDGLSLECMLKGSYFNISTQYFKLIICSIYPFILAFLSLIFIRIVQSIKKEKMIFLVARTSTIREARKKSSASPSPLSKNSKIKDSTMSFENLDKMIRYSWVMVSVFLCILILCFPDIIKVILSMFACVNFGDNENVEYRLMSDYTVQCETKTHKLWTYFFAVPFLIIIGVIFPLYVMINMGWAHYKKKMEERDRETLLKYGFFFYAYKDKLYFWDLLILIRKLLLLFINIFFMTLVDVNTDLTPILLVFLIMVVSVLLQYHFAPFDEEKFNVVNKVESVSLSTLVITILATLFYFGETVVGRIIDSNIIFFLILVTVIANCFFLAYFLKAFYYHNVKVKLIQAKEKSEMLFSKLKTFKTSIRNSSMWATFSRKFSSKNSPLPSPPIKISKSKSRPISLFKSNYDASLKKELFSPLKKLSNEEKKEQKKILFVLTEILLKRGQEDMERYNLLMLEQERIKDKLMELTKEKKPSEIDLGNEIPEEKMTEDQGEIGIQKASGFINKIYNNQYFYNLACLNESNLLVLNSFFSTKSKCKLKNNKFSDYYMKIKLEFNFKEEIDEFIYEMKEGDEFSVIFEESKPKGEESNPLIKIIKIYLKSLCIPISFPQLIVKTKKDKKEIRYEMKLPCSLNKFLIFEMILSENIFMDDWKSLLHINKKIRIEGTIANSLEKLRNFFPNSQILENPNEISIKKDEIIINERFLYGKFKLIFYEDFEYYYKMLFNEKNTHINFELSYPEREIFDPRQKFIGEVILDNYKKLFGPVN